MTWVKHKVFDAIDDLSQAQSLYHNLDRRLFRKTFKDSEFMDPLKMVKTLSDKILHYSRKVQESKWQTDLIWRNTTLVLYILFLVWCQLIMIKLWATKLVILMSKNIEPQTKWYRVYESTPNYQKNFVLNPSHFQGLLFWLALNVISQGYCIIIIGFWPRIGLLNIAQSSGFYILKLFGRNWWIWKVNSKKFHYIRVPCTEICC